MARLVFGVHGLRSALNNTTALARLLVERGHDVTFVSFRDVATEVAHIGADFVLLSDGPDAVEQVRAHRREHGDLRSVRLARQLRRTVLQLREPCQVLRDLNPDFVIIDSEMHGLVLAAHHLELPVLLTLSWHDPVRSPTRPPMHRELPPPTDTRSALAIRLAWIDLIVRRRLRHLLGPLLPRAAIARVLPQQLNTPDYGSIREMAANLGIDLASITSRHDWVNPHIYVHRPIMSFTLTELELDQTSAPGVKHVGPIIDPDRHRPPLDAGTQAVLSEFVQRSSEEGRRLVYCSMGSLQAANLDFYQMVVDAFAADPSWALVVGLGGRGEGLELDVADDTTMVVGYAPQLELLEACAVAIHTGGASTFYECLRYGVASIIMHTGRTDMPGIAARVRHFELGVVLNPAQVTPESLLEAANHLGAGSVEQPLTRVRQQLRRREQETPAVALIEELLGADSRPGAN